MYISGTLKLWNLLTNAEEEHVELYDDGFRSTSSSPMHMQEVLMLTNKDM
tara:strand:+ start:350 stop:499 length:150 start_codon:yes stop_codon:yes gene_type:complete